MNAVTYTILSVIIVSLVSLIGIISLGFKNNLNKLLLPLVSLSAGTLFGGAFLHLLPEAVEKAGFTLQISLTLLSGIVIFFILEKLIHWRHCHAHAHDKSHKHKTSLKHIAIMNLTGDGLHNFLDGLIIAGSYMISVPVGIATTIAVILHEVPQEIADFGVLVYSGLSKSKAILFNFLSAAVSIVGAVIGLILGSKSGYFIEMIVPFAAGGFIYIAGSNLIPELHKECRLRDNFSHLFMMLIGIGIMFALTFM
jgi:zinc and cadmium transporter